MPDKVAIYRGVSYAQPSLSRALEKLSRDIDLNFLKGAKRVLLKPNLISARPPEDAATTHPAVVEAVCSVLRDFGIEIIIGDSSAVVLFGGTREAFRVCGIEEAAKKFGAMLVAFETSKRVERKIPGGLYLESVSLPAEVEEADFIINLPKLKTHTLTVYTGAVKNLFGLVSNPERIRLHREADAEQFCAALLDVYSAVKPRLSIMDGILAHEGNGPTAGSPLEAGVLAAAADALALDWTLCRMAGLGPKVNPMMNIAARRGLVPAHSITGDGEFPLRLKKPLTVFERAPGFLRSFVMLGAVPKIKFNRGKCVKCGECALKCPAGAITLSPYPELSAEKCVRCFCCHEVCPVQAVELKDGFPFNLVRRLRGG